MTEQRYDVWVFSSLPQYKPRQGVVSIIEGLTLEAARAYRDKSGDAHHYGLIYLTKTRKRVS